MKYISDEEFAKEDAFLKEELDRLKEIERRWNNIQPRYIYIIDDVGHYVNKAVFEKLTFQDCQLYRFCIVFQK